VNANFIFEGLKVRPAVNFRRESGGVYDFREEDSNGQWEASGRRLGKEAGVKSGRFLGVFFRQGDQGGRSLLDGGMEDVEKNQSRRRKGRAGGRHEKVRSFWQRRHRSLEDSWLLDFLPLRQ
jgi:hypothetical protein